MPLFFFAGLPPIDNFPVFLSSSLIIFGIYHYYYNLPPLYCTVVCYFKYMSPQLLSLPLVPFLLVIPSLESCMHVPGDQGDITCY